MKSYITDHCASEGKHRVLLLLKRWKPPKQAYTQRRLVQPHYARASPPPSPSPQVRRCRAAWCTKRESHLLLPSLEVRHGTHYMETACGAKCKRVVQRELENTSVEQLLDGEKSQMHACFLVKLYNFIYCTRAIITRGLYTFYLIFEVYFFVFKEVFWENSVLKYG